MVFSPFQSKTPLFPQPPLIAKSHQNKTHDQISHYEKKETDELNNILFTVPLQENNFREGVADEKGSGAKEGRHRVIHSIKIGHGHGAAGGGGEAVASRSPGSTSNGETGNNGESTTTPTSQGGTAVIPVYTAGAVNNHRPNAHHGAASPNQQSLGPLNLCASVLAILVLHVYLVCGNQIQPAAANKKVMVQDVQNTVVVPL